MRPSGPVLSFHHSSFSASVTIKMLNCSYVACFSASSALSRKFLAVLNSESSDWALDFRALEVAISFRPLVIFLPASAAVTTLGVC